MRKIILTMSMSLDGYSEGPGRDISWHRIDDEVHRHVNAYLATLGGFLDGRVTHELMAGFWPTADADPSISEPMKEFAAIWREMPKTVYSRTLERADWNTTVVREVVPDEVRALKARPGGDLSLGGAGLAASFMAHGLIDEFHIYVHPVLIGGGTPLFPAAGAFAGLDLAESRSFGNGVVLLHYRRAGESGPE
ncbi:dihydrofolate reductase family protein [Streptomyces sp. NPDC090052]|uniref:dihydrofolate reductase family protein n=1 Tax=unclassified Streptomyces TaxID=2593676 RepID=UPI00224E1934|nr:dihydrofolate reductase family protein [Streptomyces sp. NBC_01306]MCX4723673.1 dihydrofolate reductase family protein [Streptomyces sp. NBC_01306]WSX44862.1 dihydrofolate reductase family protein [Streptomyces sp. NBC_00963]